jgi:hypothetical protein
MVFAIKPLSVPAFEGGLQGNDEEIMMGTDLNADSTHHLALGDAWLILKQDRAHKDEQQQLFEEWSWDLDGLTQFCND